MLRSLGAVCARPPCRPPALLLLPPTRGRKTRDDPPAKSKVGRVKTPPAVDPAELFVVTERYRHYRQTVRALRQEFAWEVRTKLQESRTGVEAERKVREEVAEHQRLMAWNRAENQRLHELRCVWLGAGPEGPSQGGPSGPGEGEAPLSLDPLQLALAGLRDCGARRWKRSSGRPRSRPAEPWSCRPRYSARSKKCCSCRKRQKGSSPGRTWRHV
ncbi:small ribosomal subunit protein mS26 isoform 1-T1 [Thomomys bottae]